VITTNETFDHLKHKYTLTVNKVMVATVKLSM